MSEEGRQSEDKCVKDKCKKVCDSHGDQVTGLALINEKMAACLKSLNDKISVAWRVTNLLLIIGVCVVGYTHVKGEKFEEKIIVETTSVRTDMARVEERVASLRDTVESNQREIIRRLKDLDRATGALAKAQGGSTSLLAKDF